jgi:hypothetical protein
VYLSIWEAVGSQHLASIELTAVQNLDLPNLCRESLKILRMFSRIFPIGAPRYYVLLSRYQWLNGRTDKATKAWSTSLKTAQKLGMAYDEALAHYEIGRHTAEDDPQRFRHLSEASRIFEGIGATYHESLVDREASGEDRSRF